VQTHFTCPDYDVAVAFELPSDAKALANMWSHPIQISCPVCRASHAVSYRDAYVTGVMSEFKCIPTDIRQARIR
jgi:hypothetical protein